MLAYINLAVWFISVIMWLVFKITHNDDARELCFAIACLTSVLSMILRG